LFDKKKVKLFFSGFFSSAKNSRFIKSAGGGAGARVIKRMFVAQEKTKVEKSLSFFFGHEILFYEATFSASALEH
jgi:hypothetical protein